MSKDFTEQEIIYAYQQIGIGKDAVDVVMELIPDCEYLELAATLLVNSVHRWYNHQEPRRLFDLMEAAVIDELGIEDGA